ncbi:MAG: UDP-N-acetylglucosamine--N-acetylmuramyl-(pentapeptide) pyrophosphoryl-undecaprenol N-acetylglucosamine transferase [Holosporales bacterium]|jgi:UDP-N-acetylglucosamine--N-acetylmuramyl-(pentapeptide) pyrophosphoryl-undecaprenol N-acetylglucosamine transferase|nr:UDP-N-acetylglucosamine--N-acetylmuramyl-(pentapeptide) pyrophosphoryl-undecaprenol N-acetylglucosamine transferase [Holosporales bacterium]
MRKNVSPLVVIAAGGTGGHVFPATCLARALLDGGVRVAFCTDRRGTAYVGDMACPVIEQSITTSSRYLMYVSLVINTIMRVWTLFRLRPQVVVGFGGYPSVPPVLAAQMLRIKTVIHEQNAVVGLANRLLSRMATKVLTSFPKTAGLRSTEKVICVGNPTRFEDRYDNVKHPHNDVFTILAFGGSQGSAAFAQAIPSVICGLAGSHTIKVFHQCRAGSVNSVRQTYALHRVDHLVDSFFDNIDELYAQADLIIARAGASTVFEIIGFQKPSILIPFKGSINGDQEANAAFLRSNEAAIVVGESEDIKAVLMTMLVDIINDRSKLAKLSTALCPLRTRGCTESMKNAVMNEVSKL